MKLTRAQFLKALPAAAAMMTASATTVMSSALVV